MKRLLMIPVASLLALASGCTLAPGYVQPTAQVPAAWPEGVAYADTQAFAGLPQAEKVGPADLYPDPRLRQVVDLALESNLDLRLAALNVERVRAAFKIQQADLWPALAASGSGSRGRTPGSLSATGSPRIGSRYGVDVGISAWEIDLFGRVRSEKDQAREQFLASVEDRRAAELSLVTAVGEAYLQLGATRQQLALARSTLQAQQGIFDLTEKQFEAGLASALDLRRVQTQVHAAQVDVASYLRQAAADLNALNLLTGSALPDSLLPANLDGIVPPADVAPGLSSDVLLGRPDVMAAEHQLKAANASIGVARAAFFPRISLTALVGTASSALSGLFGSGSDTWTFQPQASMPIFDLRTRGALKVSQADREILLAQYQQALQTAFREVADALATQGTIGEQVAAQTRLAEAAGAAYDLATKRFETGADSYLSVLDAQRSLYSAQNGLLQMKQAQLASKVRLYAVLGGGRAVTKATTDGGRDPQRMEGK